MSTITTSETRIDAMRRLLEVARESGVRLGTDPGGDFWATSVSEPGRLYAITPDSCGCRGFQTHRRCRHVAALWSHLGYLDDEPTPPAASGPVVELRHLPGQWIDDDLTPAGMVRFREARMSIMVDGVEVIRVNGEDRPRVVSQPGTLQASDVRGAATHFDSVVMWIRNVAPGANLERLLADAELFHPAEFHEETELVAA